MVSIIIPAYNAENTIEDALKAVVRQSYKEKYEIIVVDDGSTDNTAHIVEKYPGVKLVHQENKGPATARNLGFKKSQGDFILFTDADCMPHKDWIKNALRHFTDKKIGVVDGSYKIGNESSLLARCIHKEILYRHIYLMPLFPKCFGSYNFCVRRNIFEEVKGFDEVYCSASGEDNDLSYKILNAGYKIYFAPEVLVQHRHTQELKKYLFEQYRHGFWRAKMYRTHPKMTRGDDYTYWKDIIEPLLSLLTVTSLILSIWPEYFVMGFSVFLSTLTILILLEIHYGLLETRDCKTGLFWGGVMFLRSFSRTLGFVLGLSQFLVMSPFRKISKKAK